MRKGGGDAYSTALRSRFRLYVYPNGFADDERLPVAVSMTDVPKDSARTPTTAPLRSRRK